MFVPDIPFKPWEDELRKIPFITLEYKEKDKILPVSLTGYEKYDLHPDNVFRNNYNSAIIFENKGLFAQFMLQNNLHDYIPKVYYITNILEDEKLYTDIKFRKFIKKPVLGASGRSIKVIKTKRDLTKIINEEKDIIISEYLDHTYYYSGHMLILNGKIIKKLFFGAENKTENFIKKGQILNYIVLESIGCDDSIFNKIFSLTNYSGFVCIDFIKLNNHIYIFEVNARPGGSLVCNTEYFIEFLKLL